MFTVRAAAATSLLVGLALGEAFTTVDPCLEAPKNITQLHQSITVTAQHQPVTTCAPSASGFGWNTYNWVSTVIPCWGETSLSSCTVTDASQVVPCTGSATTITSLVPTSTAKPNGTYETWTSTNYQTVSKLWVAPYNKLGPFAIPGYGGNELCKDCGAGKDGSRNQKLDVTECTSVAGKAPVCSQFADTWTSKSAPSTTGTVTAAVSTHAAIPSAGKYTFHFPQQAPSTTIRRRNHFYTIPGRPWTATVTRSFAGPTSTDIVVTVTKTVTFSAPYQSNSNPVKTSAPAGFPHHGWGPRQSGPGARPTASPTWGSPQREWAAWNSLWRSHGAPGATTMPAGTPSSSPQTPPFTKPTSIEQEDGGPSWADWGSSAGSTKTTVTFTTTRTFTTAYVTSTASASSTTSKPVSVSTTTSHTAPTSTSGFTSTSTSTSVTSSGTPSISTTTLPATFTSTTTLASTTASTTTSVSASTTFSTTSTPYSITSASSTTSAYLTTTAYSTTTAFTTTSASYPAGPSSFYIEVAYSGLRRRYTKRGDTTYIGFVDGSDDASVVNSDPTKFSFDTEGNLRVGSQYVSGDSSSGYFVFEKSDTKPSSSGSYSLSADGTFSPPAGGAFCATPDNFFVTFGSSPSNCKAVTCKATADEVTTTSSTSFSTTQATTTTEATTTTTADVSGDAEVPDPTPFVRRSARY